MTDYLNSLFGVNIPFWVYAAVPAVLVFLVIFLVWFIRSRIFKFHLKKIIQAQDAYYAEEALKNFELSYPAEKLVRYSRRMERYSRQMGPQVVRDTGLADKWVQKFTNSALPSVTDLRRVLLYCPETNVFKAFIAASLHPRLRSFFFEWVQDTGEEKVIRLLAETCRGEEFNPAFCVSFLETQWPLLRELTSEPEWYTRYFAYKLLLLDKDVLTEKVLEEGLMDSHPLIRKILTNSFTADNEKIWNVLWDKLIHDPVFEVRETARKRIAKEFIDTYSLNEKNLSAEETARILELLDPDSQEDRTFAMTALESSDKELRYHAAAFLDKYGILSSYLAKNTLDDPNSTEQSVNLLQKALEVNVSGFLNCYQAGDGAPLLVAARLLSGPGGTQEDICYLEKKVFAFFNNRKIDPSTVEIYTKTLEAIVAGGNVKAFELLAEELSGKETDPIFLEYLLPIIPKKTESMFSAVLFRFLENTAFPARERLVQLLGTFSPDIVLPEVFRILDGSRAEYPHIVRISALKIMGRLLLPFCLQRILESLPTFSPDEAEEFAGLILSYPKDMFEEKAGMLLASPDARIRASLITILPVIKNESFLKEIKASLKDVDPDVRVAAIKALLGFGEIRLLNQETSMLRDPVERVRIATVEVIAKHGNAAAMEILKNITTDENETDTVKISVITGLGQSTSAEGIPILINVLDSSDEFREYAVKALANRTSKRDITKLIEVFKDAEPQLREKLIPVFKAQGKEAEPWILEILKDEVASLKPYLVKILEETGYVDRLKRCLSHRNAEVRREAAQLLSLLDTLPAFRGLVIAAKDPDQEVRVCVVKALEKLKNSQSQDILEKLKEDPDNRIRKYTYWALERLESLKME
ncbi:MAG: HEAT repeat domain-containing protein [Treponema sp.]|jgi:HEAT repeat protein|nr:HEAT repeat domain-containing protein [Treponema sp.]